MDLVVCARPPHLWRSGVLALCCPMCSSSMASWSWRSASPSLVALAASRMAGSRGPHVRALPAGAPRLAEVEVHENAQIMKGT